MPGFFVRSAAALTATLAFGAAAQTAPVQAAPMQAALAPQGPAARIAAQREAMTPFDWMNGSWRGEAIVQTPAGERRITQTERVGPMLDGTLRVIEGKGFNPDGSAGFNAFAVISFDPTSGGYTFRSYAQGHEGSFPVTATADQYIWQIPAGPGTTIRYTAGLQDGHWRETGERVVEGQPAQRIFEMTLTRIGENAGWPALGGPGAK